MASAPETNAVPDVPPHVLVVALQRAPKRPRARSAPAEAAPATRAATARDILSAWEAAGGPSRHVQRWLAATAVLRCLDEMNKKKPSDALDLSALRLGELPPFVETLSHLRTLSLSENALSAPPDLGKFPGLRVLSLRFNSLATAPNLRAQSGLKEFDLGHNRIAIPPNLAQSKLLERADFGANRLLAMPDVRGLDKLKALDLRDNCLRIVPDWIGKLPAGLTINLQGNPLSAATIAFLHQLSEDRMRPRVLFDEQYTEADTPASLASEIDFWLRSSQGPSEALLALQSRWKDFEGEPDADNFALLLNKLVDTADFQSSDATRHALLQGMPGMLAILAREDALRARCFELAADGVGACEDRVALAFSRIQATVLASACAGDRPKLLRLARGEFRLAHLDEIARNDEAALNGGTEEVEVVLAYRCRLAHALELPGQPQGMFYGHVVRIGAEQLKTAVDAVKSAEANPGAFAKFTAELPFWRESLDRQAPFANAVNVLRNAHLNQLDALEQERLAPDSALTSGKYVEREAEINAAHAKKLDGLYERITAGLIDRYSVPPAPEGPTA